LAFCLRNATSFALAILSRLLKPTTRAKPCSSRWTHFVVKKRKREREREREREKRKEKKREEREKKRKKRKGEGKEVVTISSFMRLIAAAVSPVNLQSAFLNFPLASSPRSPIAIAFPPEGEGRGRRRRRRR